MSSQPNSSRNSTASVLHRGRPKKPSRKSFNAKGAHLWDLNLASPQLSFAFKLQEERASRSSRPESEFDGARRSEIVAFYEGPTLPPVGPPPPVPSHLAAPSSRTSGLYQTPSSVASSAVPSPSGKQSPTTPSRRQPYLFDPIVPLPNTLVFPSPSRTPPVSRPRSPHMTSPPESIELTPPQAARLQQPPPSRFSVAPSIRSLATSDDSKTACGSDSPGRHSQTKSLLPNSARSERSSLAPLKSESGPHAEANEGGGFGTRRKSLFLRRPILCCCLVGAACLVVGLVAGAAIAVAIKNSNSEDRTK